MALAQASRLIDNDLVADNLAELLKVLEERVTVPRFGQVLDEQVREVLKSFFSGC